MMMSDEVVKGAMAGYDFEHVEVAAYKVLISAAEYCGDAEASAVCQCILNRETAMAGWLGQNFEQVIEAFLSGANTDLSAKV